MFAVVHTKIERYVFQSFFFVIQWLFYVVFSFFWPFHCIFVSVNWIDHMFISMTSFFSPSIAIIFLMTTQKCQFQWRFTNEWIAQCCHTVCRIFSCWFHFKFFHVDILFKRCSWKCWKKWICDSKIDFISIWFHNDLVFHTNIYTWRLNQW